MIVWGDGQLGKCGVEVGSIAEEGVVYLGGGFIG
jgi:hypothetical protein